jgi:8-oxo-dGTP diphosphatase
VWDARTSFCQIVGYGFFREDFALPLRPQEWRSRRSEYRATPGGDLEDGETFEQAAIRELKEETGIGVQEIGPEIERRIFVLQLPSGEHVMADERFFLVRTGDTSLSRDGWTAQEADIMTDHKWWSRDELAQSSETVWPENLATMLDAALNP